MADKSEKAIDLFVKSIVSENYSDAKDHLQDAVVEKIKDRIRACEEKYANKK